MATDAVSERIPPGPVNAAISAVLSSDLLWPLTELVDHPQFVLHGYPQQIPAGTVVQDCLDEPMHSRTVERSCWLFFADLEPFQPFSHRVLYVYVDAETEAAEVFPGHWWPRIGEHAWLEGGGDDTSTWVFPDPAHYPEPETPVEGEDDPVLEAFEGERSRDVGRDEPSRLEEICPDKHEPPSGKTYAILLQGSLDSKKKNLVQSFDLSRKHATRYVLQHVQPDAAWVIVPKEAEAKAKKQVGDGGTVLVFEDQAPAQQAWKHLTDIVKKIPPCSHIVFLLATHGECAWFEVQGRVYHGGQVSLSHEAVFQLLKTRKPNWVTTIIGTCNASGHIAAFNNQKLRGVTLSACRAGKKGWNAYGLFDVLGQGKTIPAAFEAHQRALKKQKWYYWKETSKDVVGVDIYVKPDVDLSKCKGKVWWKQEPTPPHRLMCRGFITWDLYWHLKKESKSSAVALALDQLWEESRTKNAELKKSNQLAREQPVLDQSPEIVKVSASKETVFYEDRVRFRVDSIRDDPGHVETKRFTGWVKVAGGEAIPLSKDPDGKLVTAEVELSFEQPGKYPCIFFVEDQDGFWDCCRYELTVSGTKLKEATVNVPREKENLRLEVLLFNPTGLEEIPVEAIANEGQGERERRADMYFVSQEGEQQRYQCEVPPPRGGWVPGEHSLTIRVRDPILKADYDWTTTFHVDPDMPLVQRTSVEPKWEGWPCSHVGAEIELTVIWDQSMLPSHFVQSVELEAKPDTWTELALVSHVWQEYGGAPSSKWVGRLEAPHAADQTILRPRYRVTYGTKESGKTYTHVCQESSRPALHLKKTNKSWILLEKTVLKKGEILTFRYNRASTLVKGSYYVNLCHPHHGPAERISFSHASKFCGSVGWSMSRVPGRYEVRLVQYVEEEGKQVVNVLTRAPFTLVAARKEE